MPLPLVAFHKFPSFPPHQFRPPLALLFVNDSVNDNLLALGMLIAAHWYVLVLRWWPLLLFFKLSS